MPDDPAASFFLLATIHPAGVRRSETIPLLNQTWSVIGKALIEKKTRRTALRGPTCNSNRKKSQAPNLIRGRWNFENSDRQLEQSPLHSVVEPVVLTLGGKMEPFQILFILVK